MNSCRCCKTHSTWIQVNVASILQDWWASGVSISETPDGSRVSLVCVTRDQPIWICTANFKFLWLPALITVQTLPLSNCQNGCGQSIGGKLRLDAMRKWRQMRLLRTHQCIRVSVKVLILIYVYDIDSSRRRTINTSSCNWYRSTLHLPFKIGSATVPAGPRTSQALVGTVLIIFGLNIYKNH